MSLKKPITSGVVLSLGSLIGALLLLIRNVLVARAVSVEDFGIAATFSITMALLETSSNLAVDRLLVQSKKGNQTELQSAAQAFEVIRGVVTACVVYLCAAPIAILFELEHLKWAYQILALVPLIRGFLHLDTARFQREMKFMPLVLVDVVPKLITVSMIPWLVKYYPDYRVMLIVIFSEVSLSILCSHIVKERKYYVKWNKQHFYTIFNFGWPLLLNGLLLVAISQADKVIVGSGIGIEELGWFSAAFALALIPHNIAARILRVFLTPILSKDFHEGKSFEQGAKVVLMACAVFGISLTAGIVISGGSVLELAFGEKYSAGVIVLTWFAVMQGIRLVKLGPFIVALSAGDTTLPMRANFLRCASIPLAVASVVLEYSVIGIALSAIIGEFIATSYSYVYLHKKQRISNWSLLTLFSVCVWSSVALLHFELVEFSERSLFFSLIVGPLISVAVVLLFLAVSGKSRRWLMSSKHHSDDA